MLLYDSSVEESILDDSIQIDLPNYDDKEII